MGTPFDRLTALLYDLRLPAAAKAPPPDSLTAAVSTGNADLVRAFVAAGWDIEERSRGFTSPLQAAASAGRLEMVELLLELGADAAEKPETLVYSPLSAALSNGHVAVAARLLDAIPNLAGEGRALMQAATSGDTATLQRLLGAGAAQTPHAGHVLRVAAWHGRFGCVKALLAAGVHPTEHPDYKMTMLGEPADPPYLPRDAARENGHGFVVNLLDGKPVSDALGARAEGKVPGRASLGDALRALMGESRPRPSEPSPLEGDERLAAVQQALACLRDGAADGRAHERGADGRPLLAMAAESGHVELVDAVLAAGAPVGATADDGTTALHEAARYGHEAVVARLLAAGADPNARDAEQQTALFAACAGGHLAIVRQLLASGADPRHRARGKGPRYYARGLHKQAIRRAIEDAAGTVA